MFFYPIQNREAAGAATATLNFLLFMLRPLLTALKDFNNDLKCAICYEDNSQGITNCGHSYCVKCAFSMIKVEKRYENGNTPIPDPDTTDLDKISIEAFAMICPMCRANTLYLPKPSYLRKIHDSALRVCSYNKFCFGQADTLCESADKCKNKHFKDAQCHPNCQDDLCVDCLANFTELDKTNKKHKTDNTGRQNPDRNVWTDLLNKTTCPTTVVNNLGVQTDNSPSYTSTYCQTILTYKENYEIIPDHVLQHDASTKPQSSTPSDRYPTVDILYPPQKQ